MQPQMVAMHLKQFMHQDMKSFSRSLVTFCAIKRGLQERARTTMFPMQTDLCLPGHCEEVEGIARERPSL
jgi:hypothetical protein